MVLNSEINNILSQLNNNSNNNYNSSILTLSKLIKNIHKSLINSQHSVRNLELDELKSKLLLNQTDNDETNQTTNDETNQTSNDNDNNENIYSTIKFIIDDNTYNLNELTKQNSLNISNATAKIKFNINEIVKNVENEEIIISKYNEEQEGISTELEINFNNDSNLQL